MQTLAPVTIQRRGPERSAAYARRILPKPTFVPSAPRIAAPDLVWSFHVMQQQQRQIRLAPCDYSGVCNDF